ncbi:MAG TPA: hypothetical protein VGG85_01155 [Terracidiphilus sp.]|jgi:hypothetical protein
MPFKFSDEETDLGIESPKFTASANNYSNQGPTGSAQQGHPTETRTLGLEPLRPQAGLRTSGEPSIEVSHVVLCSSASGAAVGDALVVRIGTIYKLEGYVNGRPVVYIGKAAEIRERIGRASHPYSSLVKDAKTKVSIKKVYGKLDVEGSGRGTPQSAQNEGLLSQEERALRETEGQVKTYNENLKPGQLPKSVLNKNRPAAGENMELWEKRHQVRADEEWDMIKAPGSSAIVFRVFIGVQVLQIIMDALLAARNRKMERYDWAPYVFLEEDGKSSFILEEQTVWWRLYPTYRKHYISGPQDGKYVDIEREKAKELKNEAEALYGYVDIWGDFVPGMLLPELPVVERPLLPDDHWI